NGGERVAFASTNRFIGASESMRMAAQPTALTRKSPTQLIGSSALMASVRQRQPGVRVALTAASPILWGVSTCGATNIANLLRTWALGIVDSLRGPRNESSRGFSRGTIWPGRPLHQRQHWRP